MVATIAIVFGYQTETPRVVDNPKPLSRFEQKHIKTANERYEALKSLTYREDGKNYAFGHRQRELERAILSSEKYFANLRMSGVTPLQITERGPSNVPGRARGLVVLPQDATYQTWLVGSSGGGIWKTTNSGASWTDVSPNFASLAITTLAYCEGTPNTIYAGSGEYIASSFTAINGDGMFKSTDGGDTWSSLSSTSNNALWQSVTRVIVHPTNPDIVLASTAPNTWGNFTSNIMKSTDGGASWTSVFSASSGAIEQIVADPTDFTKMYAAQNGVGILGSTDSGESWELISNGMSPDGRVEIAISPVNTSRLYASAVGSADPNGNTDLYYSTDYGQNWTLVIDNQATVDVLGSQGWYDNTILADPFDLDEFYVGGIGIYKFTVDTEGGITESDPFFKGVDTGGTETFMARVNFSAGLDGGTLELGSASSFTSVEVRFGPGRSQKAHRFLVPSGRGAGVADNEYQYQDYVDVPFEVWDVGSEPERQLMVAFRDQQRNGTFDLIENNTEGGETDTNNEHSREYLYINSRTYDAENPSSAIATTGGHVDENLFFFWPYLVNGAEWDPNDLPESEFRINWGTVFSGQYGVASIADPYGSVDGKNNNVHPDHHNLVAVIHDNETKEWQIINVNDGASYSSNVDTDPGISSGDWDFAGSTMNTTQFYGADKAPGEDRYVAGAQDNGSWVSADGESASKTTEWSEGWGGDGFDAIWHHTDPDRIIVTSQNLNVARSTNGGSSFSGASSGLDDSSPPFIGQFAHKIQNPNTVFTVGADGIYRSLNFASTWSLVKDLSTSDDWFVGSMGSIEISDATPDVVWAGGFIRADLGDLWLSVDGGETFNNVPDNGLNFGYMTGVATSPHDHKTVYSLFSYADSPKVIRSTDLGETWEDISGFDVSSTSTGFPDVAVYDLVVMPHDENTIWVGSEIGIIESTDNGSSWHLLNSTLPRVSVWDLEFKDDQIVIATHGRGVWSYTLPETPVVTYYPEATKVVGGFTENAELTVETESEFDELEIYVDGELAGTIEEPAVGLNTLSFTTTESQISVYVKGIVNGNPFTGKTVNLSIPSYQQSVASYSTTFTDISQPFLGDLDIRTQTGFTSRAINSIHNYLPNTDASLYLLKPIIIQNTDAKIRYEDIAIVEPGENDYVIVEGSEDGLNWTELSKYDASDDSNWESIFNSSGTPTPDNFKSQEINLLDFYDAGDIVIFRFRLVSDGEEQGWGWIIDNLEIQEEIVLETEELIGKFNVYPNPVTNQLYIESGSQISNIKVMDLYGKSRSLRISSNVIDLSSLSKGVYIVQFDYQGTTYRRKVLKK